MSLYMHTKRYIFVCASVYQEWWSSSQGAVSGAIFNWFRAEEIKRTKVVQQFVGWAPVVRAMEPTDKKKRNPKQPQKQKRYARSRKQRMYRTKQSQQARNKEGRKAGSHACMHAHARAHARREANAAREKHDTRGFPQTKTKKRIHSTLDSFAYISLQCRNVEGFTAYTWAME